MLLLHLFLKTIMAFSLSSIGKKAAWSRCSEGKWTGCLPSPAHQGITSFTVSALRGYVFVPFGEHRPLVKEQSTRQLASTNWCLVSPRLSFYIWSLAVTWQQWRLKRWQQGGTPPSLLPKPHDAPWSQCMWRELAMGRDSYLAVQTAFYTRHR